MILLAAAFVVVQRAELLDARSTMLLVPVRSVRLRFALSVLLQVLLFGVSLSLQLLSGDLVLYHLLFD